MNHPRKKIKKDQRTPRSTQDSGKFYILIFIFNIHFDKSKWSVPVNRIKRSGAKSNWYCRRDTNFYSIHSPFKLDHIFGFIVASILFHLQFVDIHLPCIGGYSIINPPRTLNNRKLCKQCTFKSVASSAVRLHWSRNYFGVVALSTSSSHFWHWLVFPSVFSQCVYIDAIH